VGSKRKGATLSEQGSALDEQQEEFLPSPFPHGSVI
jgi:hypothetical protein